MKTWIQNLFRPKWNRVALEARIQEQAEEILELKAKIQAQFDYILFLNQKPSMERVNRPPGKDKPIPMVHGIRAARTAAYKEAIEPPIQVDPDMEARADRYKN